jgi:hypothetical protein
LVVVVQVELHVRAVLVQFQVQQHMVAVLNSNKVVVVIQIHAVLSSIPVNLSEAAQISSRTNRWLISSLVR